MSNCWVRSVRDDLMTGPKVFISAWQGPWGWRNAFYGWYKRELHTKQTDPVFELVDDKAEAEVVFQGDLNGWRDTVGLPASVLCMANVLDFGEWVNAGDLNPETVEFVKQFKKRGASFTAISPKVITQLKHKFGVNADIFHYPSQVTKELIRSARPAAVKKRKQLISFCRHGDPGKAIPAALKAWEDSGAVDEGWRWLLVGPEAPRCPLPKGTVHLGFVDAEPLYMMVAQSTYVIMPSYGEGLGLPMIEGLLVGTPFITRDIEPMNSIWGKYLDHPIWFTCDSSIRSTIHNAIWFSKQPEYLDVVNRGFGDAHPWIREVAFNSLAMHIKQEIINA